MVHLYQSPHDTGILSKKMGKAFENQYLETSMGECMYKCWGFKDVRSEQNPKRGDGIINGGTHIIKPDERARK
jgi:hypothetical protein